MKSYKFLFLAFILAALSACSNDAKYDENVTITPTEVKGSVGGIVFDAATNAPLEGVNVMVVAGGYSYATTTDASGIFSVSDITSANGNAVIYYSVDGYLSANASVQFNIANGDSSFPEATATASPVFMVPNTGSFSVKIIDPDGNPIAQAPIHYSVALQYFTYDQFGNIDSVGSFSRRANTNALGVAEFTGLPDLEILHQYINDLPSIAITIPEIDIDGDGFADYSSLTRTFNQIRNGSTQIIQLSYVTSSSLSIIDSNNPYFTTTRPAVPGAFAAGDVVTVLFNKTPAPDSVEVTLIYKDTITDGAADAMWTIEPELNGRFLSITLPGDLTEGNLYYLTISARDAANHSMYIRSVPLFTKLAEDATINMTLHKEDPLNPASPVIVTFNTYVGLGNTTSLSGTNGVVFFNRDLDSSGMTGDSDGETGYYSTSYTFNRVEETPYWLTGYTNGTLGFSRIWKFTPPDTAPAGTTINFTFDTVYSSYARMHTPEGIFIEAMSDVLPAN